MALCTIQIDFRTASRIESFLMSLHEELLSQARHLAQREPRRPKQASLRRAVSAAYYALFHLLTTEASKLFSSDPRVMAVLNRSHDHGKILEASRQVAKGNLPYLIAPLQTYFPIPVELTAVANAFVELQQARHEADYNLLKTFTRTGTLQLIFLAEDAFGFWRDVRKDEFARLYLGSFLLWDVWNKKR